MKENELTQEVIGAAMEVHRTLGPGLLESVYEDCLAFELGLRDLPFERQKALTVNYKGHALETCLRIDLVVGNSVLVELKALDKIMPIHQAQLLTYLRLSNARVGLLINFNVPVLKDGIKRMVNSFPEV
jgi:GxxExxY protein